MKNIIEEYRELLNLEESIEGIDRSILLIEQILGAKFTSDYDRELDKLSNEENEQLDHFKMHPDSYSNPYMQKSFERRRRNAEFIKMQARILKIINFLMELPKIINSKFPNLSENSYSIFIDTSLLLFHHTYFSLLPTLKDKTWVDESRSLIQSFLEFSTYVTKVSDSYTIRALCFDYLGKDSIAAENYKSALRSTHSDADEYMTVLQTYWTFHIERDLYEEALNLLLEEYPRITRRDLDEISELIKLTFNLHTKYLLEHQQ